MTTKGGAELVFLDDIRCTITCVQTGQRLCKVYTGGTHGFNNRCPERQVTHLGALGIGIHNSMEIVKMTLSLSLAS